MSNPLSTAAALALIVWLGVWLERRTPLRHVGASLLVILITALVANLGLLPTYSEDVVVYGLVFGTVAPVGIFLLLLEVDLGRVLRTGGATIGLFLLGAVGTLVGVLVGMRLVDGQEAFGELAPAVAGMFVGTYTGGSANYNALAIHYDVARLRPVLFAGAAAVDSLMTVVWMGVTLSAPRWVLALQRRRARGAGSASEGEPMASTGGGGPPDSSAAIRKGAPAGIEDRQQVDVGGLALLLALASGAWAVSLALQEATGFPAVLTLTTAALVLAQVPALRRIQGARVLGLLAVYVFLAVIGALCDLEALRSLGSVGGVLFLFVSVVLLVHGLVLCLGARLLRADPVAVAVASQAGIGGGTTALALARSLGREDQALPGILAGSLGTALGTYLGFVAAGLV